MTLERDICAVENVFGKQKILRDVPLDTQDSGRNSSCTPRTEIVGTDLCTRHDGVLRLTSLANTYQDRTLDMWISRLYLPLPVAY